MAEKMKIFIALSLVVWAQCAYCQSSHVAASPAPNSTIVQTDAEIPADARNAVHKINGILFQSMDDNKPSVMINMFAARGMANASLEENVDGVYARLGELAKDTKFTLIHEYLIDAKGSGTVSVTLPGEGGSKFVMTLEAGKGPLFMSLLVSSGNFNDLILSFVYLKTAEGWQLYTFHCGLYRVDGKNALKWYAEAKDMYEKGWEVTAMQRIQLLGAFLRPAPFLKYANEKEIQDFFKKGAADAAKKYKFPILATWVKDRPPIYGFDFQFIKGRLTPVIIYVTKYQLNRGVPIQEEVDAITSQIGKIIPGITETSDVLVYRAFSEPPLDPEKKYKYRTIQSQIMRGL